MPAMSLHSIFWAGGVVPPSPGGGHSETEPYTTESHDYWLRKLHILIPLLWFLN
jgi:hypothetical protein